MHRVLPEIDRIGRIDDLSGLREYEGLIANWLEWGILRPAEAHALRERLRLRRAELEAPVGAA